jgi:hypothetical protein
MRILSCVLAACAAASFSSVASASIVGEIEPNNSFGTAQNLDGLFSLGGDPNVSNSTTIPYVSVISGQGGSNADFYSFTVGQANTVGIFDIDYGMPDFDSTFALYDANQTFLQYWDDAAIDPGSEHGYDAFANYTFANAGLYYLRVATYNNDNFTGDYRLNVSLQAPGSPGAVPEPATWAMMLMGFGAAGYSLRRRRSAGKLAHA